MIARPPLPLTILGRRSEGKGSKGIADELGLEPPCAVVARCPGKKTTKRTIMHSFEWDKGSLIKYKAREKIRGYDLFYVP
jgi:hypothetical protein